MLSWSRTFVGIHCKKVGRPPHVARTSAASKSRWSSTRSASELPGKVPVQGLDLQENFSKSLHAAQSTAKGPKTLNWSRQPRNILIVRKPKDDRTRSAFLEVTSWLRKQYPDVNIVVEQSVADEVPHMMDLCVMRPKEDLSGVIDFVITLGGDGTVLHTSQLFPKRAPPIIPFSLGTLGFLLPFGFVNFAEALKQVIEGSVPLLQRMRLDCVIRRDDGTIAQIEGRELEFQALNDIVLHRGRYPHMITTECSVDGEFLTGAIADGLIVSTPTGSTAYSLSAGGSLVHPSVQSILLTPICPRSLSFRPALLPPDVRVNLRLSKNSRATAEVSVDGRDVYLLGIAEHVEIKMSDYPLYTIARTVNGRDWVRDINHTLKWNQGFVNTHR
ncbi:ATP-NAD kinase [Fimicolochytrium jonesii]|uniref:ATP-NAD kinase n=1 Tax=Fimicolochytrium jonesii TaxID=1396493 RepID=UPI0022FE5697|nr:ATP-NAD kinase [Fimicolochytrium jonesii]KAI8822928.1 ATP-NAD kinase [Fimicolochytrium jonesii]